MGKNVTPQKMDFVTLRKLLSHLPLWAFSCFKLSRFSQISCHAAPAYLEYRASFLQCACSPGWIGEFCQYVGDACLIKPNGCLNGATCITMSQPSSPPQYTCRCPLGFTGKMLVLCFLLSCFCGAVCLAVHCERKYGSVGHCSASWWGILCGVKWPMFGERRFAALTAITKKIAVACGKCNFHMKLCRRMRWSRQSVFFWTGLAAQMENWHLDMQYWKTDAFYST